MKGALGGLLQLERERERERDDHIAMSLPHAIEISSPCNVVGVQWQQHFPP